MCEQESGGLRAIAAKAVRAWERVPTGQTWKCHRDGTWY